MFDTANVTKPQSSNYLGWVKQHLAQGHPSVAFVMCKGDSHTGDLISTFDHIEPIWGLYSNHNLNDPAVYDDDWLVHGSDYAPDGDQNKGYFRPFNSMVDTKEMNGNCKNAQAGFMKNEMYPCIYDQESYGVAIKGLVDPLKKLMPLYLTTPYLSEPNVTVGEDALEHMDL